MIWDYFINIIKRKISKPDKKEWLEKLVENLEKQRSENVNLPFKIIELKNTGFVAKVSGLFAFISFEYMPWRYSKFAYWAAIYPTLIGKTFYCQIHDIKKDPSLFIILNGTVNQLKKTELITGECYKGIIIEKTKYGVFVDIGFHFDWKCGSFIGLLHKSQFEPNQLLSDCLPGDEIEILYQGLNEKDQRIYSQTNEMLDWENEIPQGLIGQTVWVQIVRNENEIKFLANGKYNGRISISKTHYFFGNKVKTKEVMENLKDGEIIYCEVTGANVKARILKLIWFSTSEHVMVK